MIFEKDEAYKVRGEIYKITNKITNKYYIGQTRSHYLNHGKYRPFGYLGRFKNHISNARSSNQNQNHCKYLNATLRKYGFDNFMCELLITCDVDDLDYYECKFITELNTKYPNGYNLTDGGQGLNYLKGKKITLNIPTPPPMERASLKRSEKTRKLISENIKKAINNDEHRNKQMKLSQNQHAKNKFERFKNVIIDENNIEQYIRVRKTSVYVSIDKISTSFVGKYEPKEETKKRAIDFIKEIIKWQCNQIAGTPLEP